jgi:hypothetical protein
MSLYDGHLHVLRRRANMTTFTLNRNLDTADFLFVALNDSSCRELRASEMMDSQRMNWNDERNTNKTITGRLKRFFKF